MENKPHFLDYHEENDNYLLHVSFCLEGQSFKFHFQNKKDDNKISFIINKFVFSSVLNMLNIFSNYERYNKFDILRYQIIENNNHTVVYWDKNHLSIHHIPSEATNLTESFTIQKTDLFLDYINNCLFGLSHYVKFIRYSFMHNGSDMMLSFHGLNKTNAHVMNYDKCSLLRSFLEYERPNEYNAIAFIDDQSKISFAKIGSEFWISTLNGIDFIGDIINEQTASEIIHEMKKIAEGYVNFMNLCEKSKTEISSF